MGPNCPCLSWEATNIVMASGTLEVYPISTVVAIGMGTQNSLERASIVLRLAPGALVCRVCRPGLFGQLSENTNSDYVSCHSYVRTDLQTMWRTLRDMKKGRV